jgi:hypothetical protein
MDLGRGRKSRGVPTLASKSPVTRSARSVTRRVHVLRSRRTSSLRSSASARGLPCPRERNAVGVSCCVQATARWPPHAATHGEADAAGIGWCRRAAGRKSRSRARVVRSWVCPRVVLRLQKSASGTDGFREARPAGSGSREREPRGDGCSRGHTAHSKASITASAVAKPCLAAQAGAGRSKGRCGAMVLARRKTPQAVSFGRTDSHGCPKGGLGSPRNVRSVRTRRSKRGTRQGSSEARHVPAAEVRKGPSR